MFTAQVISYSDALRLIAALKQEDIAANITSGGVSIQVQPDRLNLAKKIVKQFGGIFSAGYPAIQEDFLLRNGSIDHVEQVTGDAIALIQEWK